jgi:hypothetical protein
MAGEREQWAVEYSFNYARTCGLHRGWFITGAQGVVAYGLSEPDARQIAREHNLHPRLVDGLGKLQKAALDPGVMDCVHNCVPASEQEGVKCEYWPCAHVPLLAACVAAGEIIAEAGKEGE